MDKNVTFMPLSMDTIEVEEIVFRGDETIDAWMDIVMGDDPLNPSVRDVVTVGQKLTAVIILKDQSLEKMIPNEDEDEKLSTEHHLLNSFKNSSFTAYGTLLSPRFDMRVKDCFAYDSPHLTALTTKSIQLTDRNGCSLRPNLLTGFRRMNMSELNIKSSSEQPEYEVSQSQSSSITDDQNVAKSPVIGSLPAGAVVYFSPMNAFKFPERDSIYFYCNIQICRERCWHPLVRQSDCHKVRANTKKLEDKDAMNKKDTLIGGADLSKGEDAQQVLKGPLNESLEIKEQEKAPIHPRESDETTTLDPSRPGQDSSSSPSTLETELKLNKTFGLQQAGQDGTTSNKQKDTASEDQRRKVLKSGDEDDQEKRSQSLLDEKKQLDIMAVKIINGSKAIHRQEDIHYGLHDANDDREEQQHYDRHEPQQRILSNTTASIKSFSTSRGDDDHDEDDDSHSHDRLTASHDDKYDEKTQNENHDHQNSTTQEDQHQVSSKNATREVKVNRRKRSIMNGTSGNLPLGHSLTVMSPFEGLTNGHKSGEDSMSSGASLSRAGPSRGSWHSCAN